MRSPPRKLTKEDQQIWKIPPCISNWKNAKGYVVPLDKRIGADGRGLQDVTVNERFASLAEDLYVAEKKAREEIKIRNDLSRQQKAREEERREQELRDLAKQARSARGGPRSGEEAVHERARREIMRETLREHRMARAGKSAADREEGRDISEQIALGKQVQPTARGEGMYDSRLFNQEPGTASGFGEEEVSAVYSTRLFTERSAAAGGYRFDAKRVAEGRQDLEDLEEAKSRKIPKIGGDSSSSQPSGSLQFVPEDDDGGLDLLDMLGNKLKR